MPQPENSDERQCGHMLPCFVACLRWQQDKVLYQARNARIEGRFTNKQLRQLGHAFPLFLAQIEQQIADGKIFYDDPNRPQRIAEDLCCSVFPDINHDLIMVYIYPC
ncbi:type IV toxin-antitoxin system YeeU family antitoxin [Pluralibacter gergoviae]